MSRYLKLVNFEFNRFLKLYLVLIGATILLQIVGVFFSSQNYLNRANDLMYKELMPKETFIEQYGTLSFFEITQTTWFIGPIALCIAVLIIYVFFIWYRDWLGKNTFIYRLLMLPTNRLNIYLAKATTILLFILGLLAMQLLLFPIEGQILQWMVPAEFRTDMTIFEITKRDYLNVFFPQTFTEFVLYYGIGMTAVFVVFTAILFERSYRLKGIIYGLLYCAVSVVFFIAPILVDQLMLKNYFYPMELFFMEVVTGLIVLAGAIWTGHFLLKNKIRV